MITYIPCENNSVVDALSRVSLNTFPDEMPALVDCLTSINNVSNSTNAMLSITMDESILSKIKVGYTNDEFCKHVVSTSMAGWQNVNGIRYISGQLLIPWNGNLHELLFHSAHNDLGHFSAGKSYASLWDAYYWPNMYHDLEEAYIPSWMECLQNKSGTSWPTGPLHLLPVPDQCRTDITVDFVRSLPSDHGFDCLLTITDRIGSDIRIIPTNTTISTKDLALLFFDSWYCKNDLLCSITCDCDKIFMSWFWKALTKLTGVKLKMSTAYHPETNCSSKHSNKTVNEMLGYRVKCHQKGWVHALPCIPFQIMNTVNASTSYSGFQLHLGRSPWIIPAPIPSLLTPEQTDCWPLISDLIDCLNTDVANTQDKLLLAKITDTPCKQVSHPWPSLQHWRSCDALNIKLASKVQEKRREKNCRVPPLLGWSILYYWCPSQVFKLHFRHPIDHLPYVPCCSTPMAHHEQVNPIP